MVVIIVGFVVMVFFAYMFIRNNAVADARIGFIRYFYEEDPEGYAAGKRFHESLPSYDEMLWKFWVWPLSRFPPPGIQKSKSQQVTML